MTPDQRDLLPQIEDNERWLRDRVVATLSPASREHLKLRVRIAGGEQWLRGFHSPKPDAKCVARVKRAVRRELEVVGPGIAFPAFPGPRGPAAAASLAAAAVLLVGVFLGLRPPGQETIAVSPLEDLAYVMEQAGGRPDADLTLLAEELDALESALAGSGWPGDCESGLDELDAETDELLDKLESGQGASDEYPA